MRIAVVTVAASGIGGMQRHTQYLLRGLAEAGHDAELIAPATRSDPRWLDRFYEAFVEAHRRAPFDVIHSESTSALGLVRRGVHREVPIVAKFQGNFLGLTRAHVQRVLAGRPLGREIKDFLWMSRVHFRHGNWWRFRDVEWIVPSRQQFKNQRRSHFLHADRGHVVPNGVDASFFQPAAAHAVRARLGLDEGPLMLAVGRLNHEKGMHTAIAALARLGPPARLIILGDGEERARLHELARTLGVEDRVQFAGPQPAEVVADYFAACDVFVFPTERDEGAPVVLVEALSSGIAVVASDIDQVSEVIDRPGENGVLIGRGDVAGLADAAQRLFADDDLRRRVGQGGRERILAEYTLEQMVQRTLAVYEVVLGRRARRESPGWAGNLGLLRA